MKRERLEKELKDRSVSRKKVFVSKKKVVKGKKGT